MTNRIAIISAACCDPRLKKYDNEYIAVLKEALKRTGQEASIDIISATSIMYGGFGEYRDVLLPHFRKHGLAIAPALFINEKLEFMGGIPPVEALILLLEKSMETNVTSQ
ncbi:MAG: hypothetical protein ACFFF4_19375 [Candidatus Thorarchaeota archaeon]